MKKSEESRRQAVLVTFIINFCCQNGMRHGHNFVIQCDSRLRTVWRERAPKMVVKSYDTHTCIAIVGAGTLTTK